jgi:hypothetical protein
VETIILPGGPQGEAVPCCLAFLLIVPLEGHEGLQRRRLALQRPFLRIRLDLSRIPTIPLPALKRQLLSRRDQAEGQVKAGGAPIDPATADRITRDDSLRVMESSIALRPASPPLPCTRLAECPSWWSGCPWLASIPLGLGGGPGPTGGRAGSLCDGRPLSLKLNSSNPWPT